MKEELLKYYPFISSKKIFVTGSPQFEPHSDLKLRKTKEEFFKENHLDLNREYICFSGDDKTTCPDDAHYLQDVAEAIEVLNSKWEFKLGILFRRCPVDFTDRYDKVLKKHEDLIAPVQPKWNQVGENWNAVIPTREDLQLQINTILHTKAVINLASSMVFDYVIFNKPCLYLNYNVANKEDESWNPQKVYNFVHFRSMPTGKEVLWLRSKEEIGVKLESALDNAQKTVSAANDWFEKINLCPAEKASERIWEDIHKIAAKCT